MSTADTDVQMADAEHSGSGAGDGSVEAAAAAGMSNMMRKALPYSWHDDRAAESDDSMVVHFPGRRAGHPQDTLLLKEPRPSKKSRKEARKEEFSRGCARIIKKWNHDLLHLLPEDILPKDAGARQQPRLLNLEAWPKTLVWELADLARLESDVEVVAEHLLDAYKERLEKDPKNPQKRLSPRDVRGAKDVVRKAKRESKGGRAVTRADAIVPGAEVFGEAPMRVRPEATAEGQLDGGKKMVLAIVGGRRP